MQSPATSSSTSTGDSSEARHIDTAVKAAIKAVAGGQGDMEGARDPATDRAEGDADMRVPMQARTDGTPSPPIMPAPGTSL